MPGAHLPNVLAARYASGPMAELWSPEHKVVLERQLWVAVLRAQRDLGLDIPAAAIDDHVAVIDKVDLASIDARRARHQARREGPDRGVLRARRPRADPRGHDLP